MCQSPPDEPGWPQSTPTTDISTRFVHLDDLECHVLEAIPKNLPSHPSESKCPLLLLLHGFPELCYSWRKVIVPLCEAGYHVVAPDQRGFGRTSMGDGGRIRFEDDLAPFRMLNLVKDIVALVYALGYDSAAAVIGHDFGSLVAGYCALIRPDLFRSVVMMSAPFPGAPSLPVPSQSNSAPSLGSMAVSLREQLASLAPSRKHYTLYFSTAEANEQMLKPPGGLHSFLRHYFHAKSANWEGNVRNIPHRLSSPSVVHLATLPRYYIMLRDETMPEAVKGCLKSRGENTSDEPDATLAWLPDDQLAVYTKEYERTGFQGGLNWYRCMTDAKWSLELQVFSGKRIVVPGMFISGKQDWGTYQSPGAAESMRDHICERMDAEDFVLIEGAGHWVQQERSSEVVKHISRFLEKARRK
uniref:Putative alpha/beta-hydrolase n=1 Tax=Moniliophthora roreri TaxID=221103 RepID=A0A0W0G5Q7_MONRR